MATRVATMEPQEEEEIAVEEEVKKETPPVSTNEALWEGGPSKDDIDSWKKTYGDVYLTEVGDQKYIVWRTLNRKEYRVLVSTLEQEVASQRVSQAEANLNNEEAIALQCILTPKLSAKDLEGDMAGIPSLISQQVMEASGFVSTQVRQL